MTLVGMNSISVFLVSTDVVSKKIRGEHAEGVDGIDINLSS